MTFLEKLQKDYPKADFALIVANYCPSHYGYAEEEKCIFGNSDNYACQRCWEREMAGENDVSITEEDLKAMYNQGLEDAWALARRIACDENDGGMSYGEMKETYDTSCVDDIFLRFTYQEAMKTHNAYIEKCSELRAGDVVMHDIYGKILVTKVEMQRYIEGLLPDGSVAHVLIKDVKRTGNHVNIAPVLGFIGDN